ncbi:MAG: FAD-binding protein [Pseudomonadales bacterium]
MLPASPRHKQLSGWGRYPMADATMVAPESVSDVCEWIASKQQTGLIARGLGRSYGDSSLAPCVVSTANLDQIIAFDETSGLLTCSAGVSLGALLQAFVPKGWFLPVSPGTTFVTVGGAIASDVHGKNHHLEGSFADHVSSLKIVTQAEGLVECSRDQRPELFHATCGGMGLTGLVVEASFKLKPIKSAMIEETCIKAETLEQALALFEEHKSSTYSVAWIDCLASGKSLGRSLLMLGEHAAEDAAEGALAPGKAARLSIPLDMPSPLLNRYTMQAFNALYYYLRASRRRPQRTIHYEPYFYPLDSVRQWNRLYGRKGFVQYQLVLPKSAGLVGMTAILEKVAASGMGSFLAVLKLFGKANDNYLSFPMEGYTLALDFKMQPGLLELLDELDQIVVAHGGRIYLTKDARMSAEVFRQGYPGLGRFREVRVQYGADKMFHSLQSQRLGIDG